ncbi:MAG: phospho-sugar mutase [Myxococcales bacterium]|nr:phospho-sugar mutase [Myxococcales bacterium]
MTLRFDEILSRAAAWADDDPDATTREQVLGWVETRDEVALRAAFDGRLEFGTAGLRGPLAPGPLGLNRAFVRRVTAGLGAYVGRTTPAALERRVVIGYDGRVGSRVFAEDAAGILGAQGFVVLLYDTVCPTPELAFAVVYLQCVAGIMVTASHNPPGDNGYKVYWGDGAQIVPPHDAGISAAIDEVLSLSGVGCDSLEAMFASGSLRTVPREVREAYLEGALALRVHSESGTVRAVYTAMHGVGRDLLFELLARSGHDDVHAVPEQAEPDGRFPTVAFPNPEEKGALDLALRLAGSIDAALVIANDPDADRLAVAVRLGGGAYRSLTGNEVGQLLASDLLANGRRERTRLVATTVVSSSMLSKLAAESGAHYAETLTGFKWIAHRALAFEANGGDFVMGYEEALGYSVGSLVRDKDGVSTAMLLLDLAAFEARRDRTLIDALDDLSRRHGLHVSGQRSVTLPGAAGAVRIREMMASLRRQPPVSIGGRQVTAIRDLSLPDAPDLPPADVLAYTLDDGTRILARPSGTEPKIKFYFEVVESVDPSEPLPAAEVRARARLIQTQSAFEDHLGPFLAAPESRR